jgi:hypothetical protein
MNMVKQRKPLMNMKKRLRKLAASIKGIRTA